MNRSARHSWRSTGLAALSFAVCLALEVTAQSQGKPSAAPAAASIAPTFEVASVKPSKSDCSDMMVSSPPGRFSAQCTTLLGLLFNAFPIKPSVTIPGMPGWGNSARFDVDAKADDQIAVAMAKLPREEWWKQEQLMIQALLTDRFKLRVHTEIREGPIYELVVAKGGFKLNPAPDSEHPSGYSWSPEKVEIRTGPIGSLAFALSDDLARKVVDKTGLTGNYDIDLKWTPDDKQSADNAGPSLFTALEEQLGLKLESAKGPVYVFIIDHVEKPSEN
jgi:uncharacterized protein (TIGR03435 family)